jgi:hypothetical protein
MRTTVDLDDELLRTAKAISEANHQTLSRVISDLAWKGLRPDLPAYRKRNGFPVLRASPSAQPVTAEHVNEMAAESEEGKSAAGLMR